MCVPLDADLSVGGSPCTPFSTSGDAGRLDDPESSCFIIFCRIHELRRTPLLLHENVEQFPVRWAQLLLPSYTIIVLSVDPSDVGFEFVRRARQYLCCVHRQRANIVHDIERVFRMLSAVLRATDHTMPHHSLCSPPEYVLEEAPVVRLEVARGIRTIEWFLIPQCPWSLLSNLLDTCINLSGDFKGAGLLPHCQPTVAS